MSAHGFQRVLVIVLDGVGVGALPDAGRYGDADSDTLGHLAERVSLRIPTLRALGLGRIVDLGSGRVTGGGAAVGKMAESSPGKDSVTGHWELMGVVLDRPFPTFPNGFSRDVIDAFSRLTGRPVLGNVVASGTRILEELGDEHLRTGAFIVYTSADSVFQIAAHEDVVPLRELYQACEFAYELVCVGLGVGRVIARPFVGTPGRFVRTAHRRDYARPPSGETLLDRAQAAGVPVMAVGKVDDLFAGKGITRSVHTASDDEGMGHIDRMLADTESGLIVANLVDFDTLYGHRNDPQGFADNLERFDRRLAGILPALRPSDLLIVTADHGNDPTTPSTDHSREYVPLLVAGPGVKRGVDLGIRTCFADVGQTLAELFRLGSLAHGSSFLSEVSGA